MGLQKPTRGDRKNGAWFDLEWTKFRQLRDDSVRGRTMWLESDPEDATKATWMCELSTNEEAMELVRLVRELKHGTHVKGTTLAELGFGNRPLDILPLTRDDETVFLIANSRRAGMKLSSRDFAGAKGLTEEVEDGTGGVPFTAVPLGGTLAMDHFGEDQILLLRRDLADGSLGLMSIPQNRL